MSSAARRTPVVGPKLAASARLIDKDPAQTIVAAAAAMMASLCIVYSLGLPPREQAVFFRSTSFDLDR
jgi:hypothetical protein